MPVQPEFKRPWHYASVILFTVSMFMLFQLNNHPRSTFYYGICAVASSLVFYAAAWWHTRRDFDPDGYYQNIPGKPDCLGFAVMGLGLTCFLLLSTPLRNWLLGLLALVLAWVGGVLYRSFPRYKKQPLRDYFKLKKQEEVWVTPPEKGEGK